MFLTGLWDLQVIMKQQKSISNFKKYKICPFNVFVCLFCLCLVILLSVKDIRKSWLTEAVWLYFITFHSFNACNLISSLHSNIYAFRLYECFICNTHSLRLFYMTVSHNKYTDLKTSITFGTVTISTSLWTLNIIEFALLSCFWDGYSDII